MTVHDNDDYGQLASDEDERALARIAMQTFNYPLSAWPTWVKRVGRENHRVLRQAGKVRAGLALYPTSQCFGGRAVSAWGVALVCVEAGSRQQGYGRRLLVAALKEMRRSGVALATLFPSTQTPYRKVGFEQAGSWYVQRQSLEIASERRDDPLPAHEIEPAKSPPIVALAEQRALRTEGNVLRNDSLWERLFDTRENSTPMQAYLFGAPDAPQGCLVYYQQRRDSHADRLQVKEMVANTSAAAATIWSFLHSHRSTVGDVVWSGSAVDSMLLATSEFRPEILATNRWMTRIVDVPLALEQRGYRTSADLTLELDIDDPCLPENAGRVTLSVHQGQGRVTPDGSGQMKIDARGLAALYSGLFTAAELQVAGRLHANDESLHIADQLFLGGHPWTPDMF